MQTVILTIDGQTPKFASVIRSYICDSVETAILKFRVEKKLWLALGASEIKGTYSFDGKTFNI